MPAKRSKPARQRPVQLEETLAARIDLHLLDPLTGKPKYGAFSKLVNELLSEWADKQEGKKNG